MIFGRAHEIPPENTLQISKCKTIVCIRMCRFHWNKFCIYKKIFFCCCFPTIHLLIFHQIHMKICISRRPFQHAWSDGITSYRHFLKSCKLQIKFGIWKCSGCLVFTLMHPLIYKTRKMHKRHQSVFRSVWVEFIWGPTERRSHIYMQFWCLHKANKNKSLFVVVLLVLCNFN